MSRLQKEITSDTWTRSKVVDLITTNKTAFERAVMSIYTNNQTLYEKNTKTVQGNNNTGFRTNDYYSLKGVIWAIEQGYHVKKSTFEKKKQMITKYWKQLLQVIESKGKPVSYNKNL